MKVLYNDGHVAEIEKEEEQLPPELRTRRMTLPQAAVFERQRCEDAAEEMRILYVMLTRAQEQLMLVNEVMTIPEEPKAVATVQNNFAAGSGCQVEHAGRKLSLNHLKLGRRDGRGIKAKK